MKERRKEGMKERRQGGKESKKAEERKRKMRIMHALRFYDKQRCAIFFEEKKQQTSLGILRKDFESNDVITHFEEFRMCAIAEVLTSLLQTSCSRASKCMKAARSRLLQGLFYDVSGQWKTVMSHVDISPVMENGILPCPRKQSCF